MTALQRAERARQKRRLERKAYRAKWGKLNPAKEAQYRATRIARLKSPAPLPDEAVIEPHDQRLARLRVEQPVCLASGCGAKALIWEPDGRVRCWKCKKITGAVA